MDRVWKVVRLLGDLALVRSQAVPVDAIFVQHLPIFRHITTVFEVGQESLTDRNVIWSRIVVQLLMPLLVEVARPLTNVMSMHDVENLITDALSVSRTFAYHTHNLADQVGRAEDLLALCV